MLWYKCLSYLYIANTSYFMTCIFTLLIAYLLNRNFNFSQVQFSNFFQCVSWVMFRKFLHTLTSWMYSLILDSKRYSSCTFKSMSIWHRFLVSVFEICILFHWSICLHLNQHHSVSLPIIRNTFDISV